MLEIAKRHLNQAGAPAGSKLNWVNFMLMDLNKQK